MYLEQIVKCEHKNSELCFRALFQSLCNIICLHRNIHIVNRYTKFLSKIEEIECDNIFKHLIFIRMSTLEVDEDFTKINTKELLQ